MGFTSQWRPQELFVLSSHQKCPDTGRGEGGGTKRREEGGRRKEEAGRRKEEGERRRMAEVRGEGGKGAVLSCLVAEMGGFQGRPHRHVLCILDEFLEKLLPL